MNKFSGYNIADFLADKESRNLYISEILEEGTPNEISRLKKYLKKHQQKLIEREFNKITAPVQIKMSDGEIF